MTKQLPPQLEELLRIADEKGLDQKEKDILTAEFEFGRDKYKGQFPPAMPGIASLYDFMRRSDDAGAIYGAQYLNKVLRERAQSTQSR